MAVLYLFGAGNVAKDFVNSKCKNELLGKYDNIFFFDSDESVNGDVNGIPIKHDLWEQKEKIDVIITSGYWYEIYEKCIIGNLTPLAIYDRVSKELLTFKEMCERNCALYRNEACIRYEHQRAEEILRAIEKYKSTKNLFLSTNGVAIMLSNLCNYACIHKKCPANSVECKEIMSGKKIIEIIKELATRDYDGYLYFHVYNEPMIDPRLFYFINIAKQEIPKAKIFVYSNGYYFNQTMIEELIDIGTDIIAVTGYGKKEYRRLQSLDVPIPYRIVWGDLDERLDNYRKPEETADEIRYEACKTFISQVCIYSNGDIGTCCLDYKHSYNLGNVYEKKLEEILNSPDIIAFQDELLDGKRNKYAICKNCNWTR